MGHNDEDLKTWFDEWRLWAGVSTVLVLAWVVWCLFRGSFDTFWPLGAIVFWALILLSAPLRPSNRNRGDASAEGTSEGTRDSTHDDRDA